MITRTPHCRQCHDRNPRPTVDGACVGHGGMCEYIRVVLTRSVEE